MSVPPVESENSENAIHLPSGDQLGPYAKPPRRFVWRRIDCRFDPSGWTVKMEPFWLPNAIAEPSGAHDSREPGWVRTLPCGRTSLSAEPSAFTTKIAPVSLASGAEPLPHFWRMNAIRFPSGENTARPSPPPHSPSVPTVWWNGLVVSRFRPDPSTRMVQIPSTSG